MNGKPYRNIVNWPDYSSINITIMPSVMGFGAVELITGDSNSRALAGLICSFAA